MPALENLCYEEIQGNTKYEEIWLIDQPALLLVEM